MSKEKFRDVKFSREINVTLNKDNHWNISHSKLLAYAIKITEEYAAKGIKMSLRQFYYQLVARGYIPNHDKVYKRLSKFVTDIRYNGDIDWDAIEDRGRFQHISADWDDVQSLLEDATEQYRNDRWENQDYFVQVICEKEALISILLPTCQKWHVRLSINKGYASASIMYELSKRMSKEIESGKKVRLLYIGDHDASVVGETPILTRINNKIELMKIEDVVSLLKNKTKIEVLALKDLEVKFEEAIGYFEHDADCTYEIKYTGGKVECTGDHSVYIFKSDGNIVEKRVSELTKDDFLVTFCGNITPKETNRSIDIPQLKTQWSKKVPEKVNIDKDFCKLVGFYNAEGCLRLQKKVPVGITIYFDDSEIEYLKETNRIMTNLFKIKHSKCSKKIFLSKSIGSLFKNLFPARIAKEKRLPSFLWTSTQEEVESYLEGYVNGDGYIRPKENNRDWGSKCICTASPYMSYDLIWLMRCRGIPATANHNIRTRDGHYKKDGTFIKEGIAYRITIPASFIREDVKKTAKCFQVPNIFKEYKIIRPRGTWIRGMRTDIWKLINKDNAKKLLDYIKVDDYKKNLIESDLGVAKIYSIKKINKKRKVYDITIANSSNFFGGTCPILLHNSGKNMVIDIRKRLHEMLTQGTDYIYPNFEVIPIAITMDQIKKYNPPPNPTKSSDPRSDWYRKNYGKYGWEADALEPEILIQTLDKAISYYADIDKMNDIIKKEKKDIKLLNKELQEYYNKTSRKDKSEAIELEYDSGNNRTRAIVMKGIYKSSILIDNNYLENHEIDPNLKGKKIYICPLCGEFQRIDDIEEVYQHIFDWHEKHELTEYFSN